MARRILIADDSAVVRLSIVRRVKAEGMDVEEHDSVASASCADAPSLACALLDLDLGDGLGTDVAARLRAAHAELPIAFFTTSQAPEVIACATSFGPVFAKPDQLDDAVAWVRRNGR